MCHGIRVLLSPSSVRLSVLGKASIYIPECAVEHTVLMMMMMMINSSNLLHLHCQQRLESTQDKKAGVSSNPSLV